MMKTNQRLTHSRTRVGIGVALVAALLLAISSFLAEEPIQAGLDPAPLAAGDLAPAPVIVASKHMTDTTAMPGMGTEMKQGDEGQQTKPMMRQHMDQMMQMMDMDMKHMMDMKDMDPADRAKHLQMMGLMTQMKGLMIQMKAIGMDMDRDMGAMEMDSMGMDISGEESAAEEDEHAGMDDGMGMGVPGVSADQFAPLVQGLYEGGQVLFLHTEASDAGVAQMLTEMMGPQVELVPALADAPDGLLANVYVFTNGIEGMGPFGFQPDIFDAVPGEPAYRPLRRVNLVSWADDAVPTRLESVEALMEAQDAGKVSIEDPGIVVNMPILSWPGGHR